MPDPTPAQPMQPKKLSLAAAMARALRKAFTKDQDPEDAKAGAQALADELPEGIMPHDALMRKRSRLQRLDEETKE